jgi:hypothetical protein
MKRHANTSFRERRAGDVNEKGISLQFREFSQIFVILRQESSTAFKNQTRKWLLNNLNGDD